MFVDTVTLTLSAGKGGNGIVSWHREKFIPKGGPGGGDGGNGGSITLRAESHVLSLQDYRNFRIIKARNGADGGSNHKKGKNGEDLLLKVPVGTLVKDADTGEVLCDLTENNQEWVVCQGGKGGKGNARFKSSTHQAPNVCTPGTEGEAKEIELELKLIADVGLIGMPNAGKSTLMSKITYVPVKIAPYPFTTLSPNLGYIQFDDFSRVLIADIPGIIENAHLNKGLGISFLKHIERTSTLIFLIDISGIEGRDPIDDFTTLRNELSAYDPKTLEKPYLIALNKTDTEEAAFHLPRFKKLYPHAFEISALNKTGLAPLIEAMRHLAQLSGKKF